MYDNVVIALSVNKLFDVYYILDIIIKR